MAWSDLKKVDRWLAAISAALLAVYFAIGVYALVSPSSDPQGGMANGFIMFVEVILLSLGGLLWLAVARSRAWLIRTISVLAIYPALAEIAQELYLLVHRSASSDSSALRTVFGAHRPALLP